MIDWSSIDLKQTFDNPYSVFVNVQSQGVLLADVEQRILNRKGFSVATLNLDHVVKLRRKDAFSIAYRNHTHVTADGNPIVWLSRLSGQDVSLVPGSELIDPMVQLAARLDVPVAFFGSTQESLDKAADVLTGRYPDLKIVAKISPPMQFDPQGPEADDYINIIAASGAQLCFLALGAPKQEIFAFHSQKKLESIGFVSIGAGLDFISGVQVRAPVVFRKFALEWLWRLGRNPGRLALRYAACFSVLPSAFAMAMAVRHQQNKRC